jgi:hypothetical protein
LLRAVDRLAGGEHGETADGDQGSAPRRNPFDACIFLLNAGKKQEAGHNLTPALSP